MTAQILRFPQLQPEPRNTDPGFMADRLEAIARDAERSGYSSLTELFTDAAAALRTMTTKGAVTA